MADQVIVDRFDLSIVVFEAGLSIDKLIRAGFVDDSLMELKRAYLRLHWKLIKGAICQPQEVLQRDGVLRANAKLGASLKPDWLPCHSALSLLLTPPCNPLSEFCRCAQQLRCEIEE